MSAPKRQKQEQSRDGEDIISSLPDSILHHILSFLDMKHVVQTSILSRRWRNVWTSLGSLKFNANQFYSPTVIPSVGFSNFVDQVFILRDNSNIDRFSLSSYYQESDIKTRLNAWIIAVVRRQVRMVHIHILGDGIRLPSCLFTCNSLVVLTLAMGGIKQRATVALPDSMGLPNLKCLLLGSLVFNDENLTNKLFLSCPNLEKLSLLDVEFQRVNVNIFSHTLGTLKVDNQIRAWRWIDSKFKLHAPNLKFFQCKDYMSRDYILENLTSLVEADINMKVEQENEMSGIYIDPPAERKQMYGQRMMKFLKALPKVKKLKLSAWFLEVMSGSPDLLDRQPNQFRSLKCLKLETWLSRDNIRAITYLLKISPVLESLFLEISKIKFASSNIVENTEAEGSLQCVLDKLVLVEIRGAVGCVNELKFLEILLKNAKVLQKLVIYTCKIDSPDREKRMMKFTEKLLTFPKASSEITILFF